MTPVAKFLFWAAISVALVFFTFVNKQTVLVFHTGKVDYGHFIGDYFYMNRVRCPYRSCKAVQVLKGESTPMQTVTCIKCGDEFVAILKYDPTESKLKQKRKRK